MNKGEFGMVGDLGLTWYASKKTSLSKTVVVYALGMPRLPDNGLSAEALAFTKYGVDVVVPDYYGFGRSGGEFVPQNCLASLKDTVEMLSVGIKIGRKYDGWGKYLKYDKIVVVGKSFGANYVALLPGICHLVDTIGLLCPCVDNKSQGSVEPEETNESFISAMFDDGYGRIAPGFGANLEVWKRHLNGGDNLDAVEHPENVGGARVFIGHGISDDVVSYTKSVSYFEKLKLRFGALDQFKLCLYPKGDHGESTTMPAIADFMQWFSKVRK